MEANIDVHKVRLELIQLILNLPDEAVIKIEQGLTATPPGSYVVNVPQTLN